MVRAVGKVVVLYRSGPVGNMLLVQQMVLAVVSVVGKVVLLERSGPVGKVLLVVKVARAVGQVVKVVVRAVGRVVLSAQVEVVGRVRHDAMAALVPVGPAQLLGFRSCRRSCRPAVLPGTA